MSRTAVLAGVLTFAVIAALAAWYLRADYQTPTVANAQALSAVPVPATEKFASVRVGEASAKPLRTITKASPATKMQEYAAQFLGAADMLSYLEALAPAAADGDVDALYYLGIASRRCTREYSTLFGPPGREMTLEVALEKEYWTKYYEPMARKIYGQCARFKATHNPFTEWEDLLAAAAEAGSGPAKALIVFDMQNGIVGLHDLMEHGQMSSDIRTLAKEAIRSKDPEVLFHLSYIDSITGRSGTPEDMAGAWMLAACQRGLECGRTSEHFQFFCRWDPECKPSETLVDLWRRRPRFDEFQRFANELNAKLDADRFDEIIP